MDDLIKALQILRKYGNPEHPTHCNWGEMVMGLIILFFILIYSVLY
jgi:hypothetical protein